MSMIAMKCQGSRLHMRRVPIYVIVYIGCAKPNLKTLFE